MEINLSFPINSYLYKKDPDVSEIGRKILKDSIILIEDKGFENFTFKKLSAFSGHTEATIYRYFENKQKLLLYLLSWYWSYIRFLIDYKIKSSQNHIEKLIEIISVLSNVNAETFSSEICDINLLFKIVVKEGNKAYFHSNVVENNKEKVFKPYKELCSQIANIIIETNPNYPYPKTLASNIIEASHFEMFFSENLPGLTDVEKLGKANFSNDFLIDLVKRVLL